MVGIDKSSSTGMEMTGSAVKVVFSVTCAGRLELCLGAVMSRCSDYLVRKKFRAGDFLQLLAFTDSHVNFDIKKSPTSNTCGNGVYPTICRDQGGRSEIGFGRKFSFSHFREIFAKISFSLFAKISLHFRENVNFRGERRFWSSFQNIYQQIPGKIFFISQQSSLLRSLLYIFIFTCSGSLIFFSFLNLTKVPSSFMSHKKAFQFFKLIMRNF